MAVDAIRGNAQERPRLIANLNRKQLVAGDVSRCVAAVASQSLMLAQQVIAGLAVVEACRRGCPFDDLEIQTVVLGVAPGTLLAGIGFEVVGGVQAMPRP